jgi:hypothetical protein
MKSLCLARAVGSDNYLVRSPDKIIVVQPDFMLDALQG